jgi:hypothetical protein
MRITVARFGLLFCIPLLSTGQAIAQESCTDVISLSKITSNEVSDQSEVVSNAHNFCSEYSTHRANSSGWNFGAAYSYLSMTMGGHGTSADDVASRYCDIGNNYQAYTDAYKRYVDNIAPGAYQAYEACVAQRADITFKKEGWTPNEFTLQYHYIGATTGAQPTNMLFSSSKGVTCSWKGTHGSSQVTKPGGSGLLSCSRGDATKAGFVTIVRTNGPGDISIQLPSFDKDGHPIETMKVLTQSVNDLRASALPVGAIIPWLVANTEPPKGWVKCDGSDARCPDLRGLFIRGGGSASVKAIDGADKQRAPFLGSNTSHPGGNGWSKDGNHHESDEVVDIATVPRHMVALYIMKVANR